jgi:hypothetical protein
MQISVGDKVLINETIRHKDGRDTIIDVSQGSTGIVLSIVDEKRFEIKLDSIKPSYYGIDDSLIGKILIVDSCFITPIQWDYPFQVVKKNPDNGDTVIVFGNFTDPGEAEYFPDDYLKSLPLVPEGSFGQIVDCGVHNSQINIEKLGPMDDFYKRYSWSDQIPCKVGDIVALLNGSFIIIQPLK